VNELFGMLPTVSRSGLADLNRLLAGKNELVRMTVMQELRERGTRDRETASALLTLAKTGPGHQLPEVLETLGRTGDPSDVPEVIPFLSHGEGPVRGAAAVCLAGIGSKDTLSALADAFLAEKDNAVRKELFFALQRLGSLDILRARWSEMPAEAKELCLRSATGSGMQAEAFFTLAEKDPDEQVRNAWQELRLGHLLKETEKAFPGLFIRDVGQRQVGGDLVLGKMAGLPGRLKTLCGAELPTNGDGEVHLSARFLVEAEEQGSDVVSVMLKPAGEKSWRIECMFTMVDLMDEVAAARLEGCFYIDCPEEVKSAFAGNRLFSRAHDFDDGRDFFTLTLSGMPIEIYRKYAVYFCDAAVLPGQSGAAPQLAVSFSGLYQGGDEIPPFVVRFDLLEVLCRKRTVFLPEGDEDREWVSPVVRK